jgi:hypothetical protein
MAAEAQSRQKAACVWLVVQWCNVCLPTVSIHAFVVFLVPCHGSKSSSSYSLTARASIALATHDTVDPTDLSIRSDALGSSMPCLTRLPRPIALGNLCCRGEGREGAPDWAAT